MKLVIVIEGKSAENLFPVGSKDLKEWFLPKCLNVKSEDVKHIHFEKVSKRDELGFPIETLTNKENF
ncbi:MAG: hypothetical protein ACOC56_00155 [Atribacterota bacterium]